MLLDAFQQLVVSSATSRAKMGIKLDKKDQAVQAGNWDEAAKIKEELLGYQNYSINGTGEAGVGKTEGTIEAANMAGLPVLLLYPSQWVDNSDAVGMPKVRQYNGIEVTKNIARDFFPRIKTDENGEKMLREDGGYMIDFESVKEYIANYEEMMIYYKGDVNKAPGLIVFWDEVNRIVVQDVQQLMFSVILNQKLGDYSFPNGTFFVSACNPNTGSYSVSALMEEEAFKDRFVQVDVENNLAITNAYMNKHKYHWSVKALANQHPETVTPRPTDGEVYDMEVKASNRSMKTLSSMMVFTTVKQDLQPGDFLETVAGLIGKTHGAAYAAILENGAERIPTGEEIITNYDEFREFVQDCGGNAEGDTRQDVMNQLKENFLSEIKSENAVDKYNLKPEKAENGERVIPPNLENIYKFFQDVPADFRVTFIKSLEKTSKILGAFSLHIPLFEMVEEDILRSRQSGKVATKVEV